MSDREHRPIDCSLHDQLDSIATLRKRVLIRFRDPAGGSGDIEEQIVDILTKNGAEYVKLGDGRDLRVDDLQEVGGVSIGDGPVVEG